MLHGTLEDVLRGVLVWKFPIANEEVLNGVPLIGLSELARARVVGQVNDEAKVGEGAACVSEARWAST